MKAKTVTFSGDYLGQRATVLFSRCEQVHRGKKSVWKVAMTIETEHTELSTIVFTRPGVWPCETHATALLEEWRRPERSERKYSTDRLSPKLRLAQ